jgi:hypothetical protein
MTPPTGRSGDDHLGQEVTDGQNMVRNKLSSPTKNPKNINLGLAAFLCYGFSLCLDVHQNLWESHGDKADATKDRLESKKYIGVCQ